MVVGALPGGILIYTEFKCLGGPNLDASTHPSTRPQGNIGEDEKDRVGPRGSKEKTRNHGDDHSATHKRARENKVIERDITSDEAPKTVLGYIGCAIYFICRVQFITIVCLLSWVDYFIKKK